MEKRREFLMAVILYCLSRHAPHVYLWVLNFQLLSVQLLGSRHSFFQVQDGLGDVCCSGRRYAPKFFHDFHITHCRRGIAGALVQAVDI